MAKQRLMQRRWRRVKAEVWQAWDGRAHSWPETYPNAHQTNFTEIEFWLHSSQIASWTLTRQKIECTYPQQRRFMKISLEIISLVLKHANSNLAWNGSGSNYLRLRESNMILLSFDNRHVRLQNEFRMTSLKSNWSGSEVRFWRMSRKNDFLGDFSEVILKSFWIFRLNSGIFLESWFFWFLSYYARPKESSPLAYSCCYRGPGYLIEAGRSLH